MKNKMARKAKLIYRLYLKGKITGYARQKGKAFLFSENGEKWSQIRIEYDDAVRLDKPPGM
jgi:hypothetical protein